MASSKEYKDYIVEQLSLLGLIQTRAMMGEYLLYYQVVYFGGIFDDRFLVKMVSQNKKYERGKKDVPCKRYRKPRKTKRNCPRYLSRINEKIKN